MVVMLQGIWFIQIAQILYTGECLLSTAVKLVPQQKRARLRVALQMSGSSSFIPLAILGLS